MLRPVIFLNPSVLMSQWDRMNRRHADPSCFDGQAFERLEGLISRVGNVAIVLIFPCEDINNTFSLEQLQAAYQDCRLGERIIGKIDDENYINDGKLVENWLCYNKNLLEPFPIKSFVIISHSSKDRYCSHSVKVDIELLSKEHASQAECILLYKEFDPNDVPARYVMKNYPSVCHADPHCSVQ